jgi:hypothetical protein
MSSSFLEHLMRGLWVIAALVASATLGARPVAGADYEFLPVLEAGVQTNTNRDMSTVEANEFDGEGYIADVGANMRWRTDRSTTNLRPLARFQEYPDSSGLEGIEGALDLRSSYRFQRGEFNLAMGYSHRDWYNAELPDAPYNPVNPDDPTVPETGVLREGDSRDRVNLSPRYEHQLSERVGLGGRLYYEASRYEGEGGTSSGVDYDFARANLFASWLAGPVTRFEVGPFASRYDAQDDSAQTDAIGLSVGVRHDWSKEFKGLLDLGYFEEDEEAPDLVSNATDSGWTASASIERQGEVSRLRGGVGRVYSPSGRGGVTESDEFRVQYDRDWSARLSTMLAARYGQDRSRGIETGSDYDYWRGELGGKYFFSFKWYVLGGYRYTWRDTLDTDQSADNSSFYLRVGFVPGGAQRSRLFTRGS